MIFHGASQSFRNRIFLVIVGLVALVQSITVIAALDALREDALDDGPADGLGGGDAEPDEVAVPADRVTGDFMAEKRRGPDGGERPDHGPLEGAEVRNARGSHRDAPGVLAEPEALHPREVGAEREETGGEEVGGRWAEQGGVPR